MSDARQRSPWSAPDCRHCGALHIYVDHSNSGDGQWRCYKCDETFHSNAGYRVADSPEEFSNDRPTIGEVSVR